VKALTLVLMGLPLWADTYPRQPGVDAQHYIFSVELRDETDEIAGEATADLRFVQAGVHEVALDLAKGMTVSEVSSGGKAVKFGHTSDRLVITLPDAVAANERRQFTVKYHGVPATGLRIGLNKYKERTFFSANWPDLAHQWLPIIDHPYDKATSEFVITAPAKYQVVANGRLVEIAELGDGRRVTHWKESTPIASWLNAIGVAQFASRTFGTLRGTPLETWVYHQDAAGAPVTFDDNTRRAMEFYSDHIGPFSYEKLANVIAAGLNGGTEHASAIFYGEGTVGSQRAPGLVAHEIAHQWFGDSVTERDWDDVWLSEGFATYFTLLVTEHYRGRDAFVEGLKSSRNTVFHTEQQLPGSAVVHANLSDMKRVLNQLVYQKGGWVLHMLRAQIGTEKFWEGIREYYKRYRDANASTAEFRKVMEEASGQDLHWFFQQWLYRAGSPVVDATWTYDSTAHKVAIELVQTQQADVYRLPLEVAVGNRVERVLMTERTQRFEFAASQQPAKVELDPGTWVLMQSKIEKR
jgi:aminopeptidase N